MYFRHWFEATGSKLAICDVQPAYQKNIEMAFDMREFAEFVNQYLEIYVMYNGPELGYVHDIPANIGRWYYKFGVKKETLQRMKWFEKNYNWFRDLMDAHGACWHRPYIVKLARYMIINRIWDWRELSEEDIKKLGIPDLTQDELEKWGFNIPDLAFRIRKLNGADICGGGINECLDEVMILAEAMNVQLNVIDAFTFG